MRRRLRATRTRLDAELVRRGLAASRAEARELIAAGRVTVAGAPATKPATLVDVAEALRVAGAPRAWASRAGHKLAGALAQTGVTAAGRYCLDAGASTGGFTDVLLSAGAARVVAVDVGYGQLIWRLRTDPRVVVRDRCNVRALDVRDLPPPPPGVVVADLSFISLRTVLPALANVAAPDADHLLLVKPQFELGPGRVGRRGVVGEPRAWAEALQGVIDAGRVQGLGLRGAVASSLPGPAGNVEFFVHLSAGGDADAGPIVQEAVAAGERLRPV